MLSFSPRENSQRYAKMLTLGLFFRKVGAINKSKIFLAWIINVRIYLFMFGVGFNLEVNFLIKWIISLISFYQLASLISTSVGYYFVSLVKLEKQAKLKEEIHRQSLHFGRKCSLFTVSKECLGMSDSKINISCSQVTANKFKVCQLWLKGPWHQKAPMRWHCFHLHPNIV